MAKKKKKGRDLGRKRIVFEAAAHNERLGMVGKGVNLGYEALSGEESGRLIRHARKATKRGFDPARSSPIYVKEMPRRGKKRK